MKYYRYLPDANHFAGIGFSDEDGTRIIRAYFTDTPLADQWIAPVAHGFEDNPKKEGDFPSLSDYRSSPVMSQRAWDILRPLIGYCCEALPIIHPSGKPHFIIHVMDTVDCLDCVKSELACNASSGRVSSIYRYAFKREMLPGKHIFKLHLERGAHLIVDDLFCNIVKTNSLKGLWLEELPMVE